MKSSNHAKEFNVDALMRKVALMLVGDFRMVLNEPEFCSSLPNVLQFGTVAQVRSALPAVDESMDVVRYKATYQILSIFKRYRFRNDTYTDAELANLETEKFRDCQRRLEQLDLDALDATSSCILDRARAYITKTLGVYSDEEHRSLCRFGRRASVGIPARKACLAERYEIPVSGSLNQIEWFDVEMRHDSFVQDYWKKLLDSDPNGSIYRPVDSLQLTFVPKSYKSFRSIMPNTTIGSYMSFGLGEMIRKRLKRIGYDISKLQMRHRYLAQRESVNNLLVTADLSSASDSISVALVRRIFPEDWFNILNFSRIGCVTLPDKSTHKTETFCTMGIGYTFPLQTLVFLALLNAIQSFYFDRLDRRTISVYGDDLIYATRMHDFVAKHFQQFGFVINVDKTFVRGHFRESCGGDYYHGVDVRPFQPQNGSACVCKKTYEAMLYKIVNGLLTRWSEHEIGGTLDMLTSEITAITGKCKLVPQDFPDDAGIKTCIPTPYSFLGRTYVSRPVNVGHGIRRFSYLKLVTKERKETRHDPYYWNALRGGSQPAFDYAGRCLQELPGPLQSFLNEKVGIQEGSSELVTREERPIKTFRSTLTGRRLRRQVTCVMISGTGTYKRQFGTSRFECRR